MKAWSTYQLTVCLPCFKVQNLSCLIIEEPSMMQGRGHRELIVGNYRTAGLPVNLGIQNCRDSRSRGRIEIF
jgi:hypothetical protein